ncbi:Re/Si-specific NAD(P)(+) transhydrogenase subunit alpha [Sediminibacterium sp. KACHI17]|jgi:H+-translocating NAD(P) transhydrogenase subunit alpha|uniref:NAD(P) transhydrogenase subunit alpha part 1 n=1 Tax=Sediminibacterium sp. KACHI17 TaxID=1751071 RepID=A0AAT9GMP6_9BACT
MILGILNETNDRRVSLLPEQAETLTKQQVSVWMEPGAGQNAFADDQIYSAKNVVLKDRSEILQQADLILMIHPPSNDEVALLKSGAILVGVFQPLFHVELMKQLAAKMVTVFSLDMIPRTTRAQSMDVLSSQANIAGYRAVLLAATLFPRYFPMFMTAAGSIPPAKVLIIGAGVAGLQAIATARRLGAVVEVSDTRPAVKEEVMSLGAKFIEVEGAADASKAGGYAVEQSEEFKKRQQERLAASVAKSDIIITTAQIPGKKAPLLINEEMLNSMKPGSVVIDLAAATGGNVFATQNNATIMHNGITIMGNSNLAADMPWDASKLYGKNILNFLQLVISKEGNITLNFEDDIVKGCCITHVGNVVNDRVVNSQ